MKQTIKKVVATVLVMVIALVNVNYENVYASSRKATNNATEKKQQTLNREDVPYIMDYKDAVKNGHVSREKSRESGLDDIVFQNSDGSYTMYVYDQNVKYIDENGETKDIDTGIEKISDKTKKQGYTYTNGQNSVNVDFPDKIEDGISVGDDKMEIKMYPIDNIGGIITVEDNTAVYEGAYGEGTKLVYTPLLSGVKEEIILESYNGKEKYTFIYEIGDGYITTLDDDCLYVYSKDDECIGLIEPIYMWDAENKWNTDSEMFYYRNEDGTWTVEVIPDVEFLTDTNTVYPVTIDPTYIYKVNVSTNSSGIQDITLNSTSTSAGKSGSLFVGNRSNTENGISRALMKIPSVTSSVCSSIEVQRARVTLRDIMCESDSMTILCCQFEGSSTWSESTVNTKAFYGSKEKFDDLVGEEYDSQIVSYSQGVNKSHTYSFDITAAVKEWINYSDKRGQGLVFKAKNESTIQNKTFASYQRANYQPTFTMTYVDNEAAFTWIYLKYSIENVVSSGAYNPNCAGFVLGKKFVVNSGTEGFSPSFSTIGHFAYSFKSYVDNYVYGKKIVSIYTSGDWREIALESNQYLIAARIGTSNNYHFMVQIDDGRWAEKYSSAAAEIPIYKNPDDDSAWGAAYTSTTAYLVVEVE